MIFRGDINGLRAIAVAAVVLFHFGVAGTQGGYVGVDVFFVISGFLMTGIIFSRLEQGSFSLWGFYKDRGRRIIPALAFLCVVLLFAGWVLLFPENYEQLARRVIGSLAFVSNFQYWKDAGYFEQASHDNWLLHTWSLSIEWQFYLIYPVIVLILRRMLPATWIRWVLVVMAVTSLVVSVYASPRWPTSAFFLLPTRMWELLAGGLIVLFPCTFSKGSSRLLEVGGIVLILLSVGWVTANTVWPGWLALLPVIGTAMVIYSARHESLLTANPVSQFLGKISYSVYLWHWPVAVGIYYFGLEHKAGWIVAGMAASVALGWLSYRYIENVARSSAARRGVWSSLRAGGAVVAACLLAGLTLGGQGFPNRISAEVQEATADLVLPRNENGWCFHNVEHNPDNKVGDSGLQCWLGAPDGQLTALLIGDSFAGHYGPFWDAIGRLNGITVNTVSTNWCYPSLNEDFTGDISGPGYRQCLHNRDYLKRSFATYDMVIFAGQWSAVYELDLMQGVLDALEVAAERAGLVVIMPAPSIFDVDVRNMYKRSLRLNTDFDISRFQMTRDEPAIIANQQLEEHAARFDNVLYFTRASMFHVNGVPSHVTDENVPFGLDTAGHISLYGSLKAAEAFRQSALYGQFGEKLASLTQTSASSQAGMKAPPGMNQPGRNEVKTGRGLAGVTGGNPDSPRADR